MALQTARKTRMNTASTIGARGDPIWGYGPLATANFRGGGRWGLRRNGGEDGLGFKADEALLIRGRNRGDVAQPWPRSGSSAARVRWGNSPAVKSREEEKQGKGKKKEITPKG